MNEHKSAFKSMLKPLIFLICGNLVTFMMYHMINNTPKVESINYGAIIYIFMICFAFVMIFLSAQKSLISLIKNIIEVRRNKLENISNKQNIKIIVYSLIIIVFNVLYVFMIESKILLNK